MAARYKNLLLVVGVTALCFLAIPIHVDKPDGVTMSEHERLFHEYTDRFNKSYSQNSTEYQTRLALFKESLKQIRLLNKQRTSNASAFYGLTKFSDMSSEEFLHHHLQPSLHEHLKNNHQTSISRMHHENGIKKRAADNTLPLSVDWRKNNIVTAIKNQKTCGACWAFSTVETIESMYALKTGVLQPLSVQEVVDCARDGNLGCSGGDTCSLLQWLSDTKTPVETEDEYPLVWETQACHLESPVKGIQIAPNFTCINMIEDEEELLALVAYHGPVIVAVNALSWQNYLGGVIQFHCEGELQYINHAAQIVGYDKNASVPHYIVRNSWGMEFGDRGYLYIGIGSNLCGIATDVSALDVL